MTPSAQAAVAEAFGGSHGVLFGRARSALLAVFEALGLHGRSILLIPSNACPSLLACAWASGALVRLAPVNARTGVNDDAALAAQIEALAAEGKTGAVLFTHLYGFRLTFDAARRAARQAGWQTIENDANSSSFAPGGAAPLADVARIVSFGPGKVLDAGAGGAVITDDPALAEALSARAARYPALDEQADRVETALTLERRRLRNAGQASAGEALLLNEISELRYAFPASSEPDLLAALARLPVRIARRKARAALWQERLAPFAPQLACVDLPQPGPWRLIARAEPEVRDDVVARLREAGIDAGTNYPALSDAFPHLTGDQAHPDSEAWARTALNLWLDADYPAERIGQAVSIIASTLEASS